VLLQSFMGDPMRRAAKVDANQARIVMALRQAGVAVEPLHAVGGGVPDLLCATRKMGNVLLEVKDGDKPPSARRLTKAQVEWHARWPGPIAVVSTVDEALEAMGVKK
jgi:hypothetical protein